jgi:hypothetical protein
MPLGLALAVVAVLCAALRAGAPAEKEAYGFKFVYADKLTPKKYLQTHPSVSGGWRFRRATDTHWIGDLTYPTGNVPPTYPDKNEAAFLVQGVKIEKQKDLPIDLEKWQGQVILLQPDAKVRFGSPKSLESSFRLVGYEAEKGKGTGFLFKKHADLGYRKGE